MSKLSSEFIVDSSESTANYELRTKNYELKCGFTLVEILVVSVLMLVLGGALLTVFLVGQTSSISADAYIQVQQEARKALDIMVRELRESAKVSCNIAAWPAGALQECTTNTNDRRLNFQVVLGYGTTSPCNPDPGICLGANNVKNNWVHYAIINGPNGTKQLVRYVDASELGATPAVCNPASCRVLANNVKIEFVQTLPARFVFDQGSGSVDYHNSEDR